MISTAEICIAISHIKRQKSLKMMCCNNVVSSGGLPLEPLYIPLEPQEDSVKSVSVVLTTEMGHLIKRARKRPFFLLNPLFDNKVCRQ